MIETITRKQLYDLIWSKPLTKVQLEVGLTYNQIKNICNEKKIPIPGSGFWIKKEYGKPLTILPLVETQTSKMKFACQNEKKVI